MVSYQFQYHSLQDQVFKFSLMEHLWPVENINLLTVKMSSRVEIRILRWGGILRWKKSSWHNLPFPNFVFQNIARNEIYFIEKKIENSNTRIIFPKEDVRTTAM